MRRHQDDSEANEDEEDMLLQERLALASREADFAAQFSKTDASGDRLNAIRSLIKMKREKREHQMSCRIDNKLIDQMLIFSQLNKAQIKESLQEECLKSTIHIDSDDVDAEDLDSEMIAWLEKQKAERVADK